MQQLWFEVTAIAMAVSKRKKQTVPASQQVPINQFGRISKSQLHIEGATGKKPRVAEATNEYTSSINPLKRKGDEDQIHQKASKRHYIKSPSTPRKKPRLQNDVLETPTKGARTLLQTLTFTTLEQRKLEPEQLQTPPPSQEEADDIHIPKKLKDLIDMHSSFLTAVSLHVAHNGPIKPADLREICASVSSIWRKRRISVTDIQMILSLQQAAPPSDGRFILVDYGHGKICVELASFSQGQQRLLVDEKRLNASFKRNLERAWKAFSEVACSPATPEGFVSSLTPAPINASPSLSKLAPRLEKLQTRLTEFKEGAVRAQERANSKKLPYTSDSKTGTERPKDPCDRSASLKSRIFSKELRQAALPAVLSPEQIARRSALHRVTDVAGVLESMALSRQRHRNDDAEGDPFQQVATSVSFTLPALVQNVQMSLRNPVSHDEAIICATLLAELVPEWISMREVGKIVGILIRGQGIGRPALSMRVQKELSKIA